jgi:hypothetical protein
MRAYSWIVCLGCLFAIVAYVDPALAQGRTLPRPGPAPLIGGGAVAGLVIAAVWIARRMRRRD